MLITLLRDAPWLTRARVRAYATILVLAGVALGIWTLSGRGLSDPAGRPVGTDFVGFWTVSWALLHGREDAVYNPSLLAGLERTLIPQEGTAFWPWQYPPIGLLLVYPLALLPYLWSLALWLAAGTAGYLSALWRILPQPLTLWAGLAYPAVLLTLGHGQNALLTTGLLGWGLLLLPRRPVHAGILFAILGFKPQIAFMVPVALIAGREWRALAAAASTFIGLASAATILFGAGAWVQFHAATQFAGRILVQGLFPYYKIQSVFAAVRLLGGDPAAAWMAQGLAAIAAAAVLVCCWRRSRDPVLRNAALAAAIPLASPYFLDYDLTIVALAIAWLVQAQQQNRILPWEGSVLALNAAAPLVTRTLGAYTHILLAPVAVALLLAVIVIRTRGPIDAGRHPEPVYAPLSPVSAIDRAPLAEA